MLASLLNEERDLRPATFIRDIHAKTHQLEEEKRNYYLNKSTADHSIKEIPDTSFPSSFISTGRQPKKYRNSNF
jgi:hypothetical protein